MKICKTCNQEKDSNEYYKHNATKDGLQPICKICTKLKNKKHYEENRTFILIARKLIKTHNKKCRRQYFRHYNPRYEWERRQVDVQYRLTKVLRSRLSSALKNKQHRGSAISDLGCSIEFLKQYLESKFKPGMSWKNYGVKGWHIDHIKPLSKFDLGDKAQFLQACHYTNLQPLWAKENLSKGASYEGMV